MGLSLGIRGEGGLRRCRVLIGVSWGIRIRMLQLHRVGREERRRRPLLVRIRLDLRGEHLLPVGVVQPASPLRVGSERNEEKLHTIPLSVWN